MYIVAYFERVFVDEAANGDDILETGLCQYDINDDLIDNEVSLDRHQLTDNSSVNVVDGILCGFFWFIHSFNLCRSSKRHDCLCL